MNPDYFEQLAAVSFEEERRAYFEALAAEAETELLARELEDAELRLGLRGVGRRYAHLFGLPLTLAPVVEVLVYSPSRGARLRAAALIARAVQRSTRDVA